MINNNKDAIIKEIYNKYRNNSVSKIVTDIFFKAEELNTFEKDELKLFLQDQIKVIKDENNV
jgi:hypothetical protein